MRKSPHWYPGLAALWLSCTAGLFLPGCRQAPSPDVSDAVAIVEGLPISSQEFQAEIQRRAPTLDQKRPDAEIRQTVLAEKIRQKALLHRAQTLGLDRDPETVRRIEQLITSIYLEKHGPDPERLPLPNDEEIRVAYEQAAAEFMAPERFRVAMIQLKRSPKATPEKDRELREAAKHLAAELATRSTDDPKAFAEAARQHSEDRASRYQGGDVGWVEMGRKAYPWPSEVVTAMGRLKTNGELSPLVETPTGFYLLKLLSYQAAGQKPLTEVRDELVHRLVRTRKQSQSEQFEKDLQAGLHIEVRQDAVDRVPVPETRLAQAVPPTSPTRTRR